MRRFARILGLVAATSAACSSDKPDASPPPRRADLGAPPATAPASAPPGDVSFLVESCREAELGEAWCACVGDKAQRELDPALLQTWRTAPREATAAAKHYTKPDVDKIVAFMSAAETACGGA